MKYSQKLQHARTELRDARDACNRADETDLKRYISNCLAAARSVLQYAYKETDPKQCGGTAPRQWYKQTVTGDDVFQFVNAVRNADIHTAPAETTNTGAVMNAGPGWIRTDPATGKVIAAKMPDAEHRRTLIMARFGNRPENALQLLEEYINRAEAVIADGRAKGFLR